MKLSDTQLKQFNENGYLVIEGLLDEAALGKIRAEYSALMDRLYEEWALKGIVPSLKSDASFFEKLDVCYKAGFDWYQPFDISLPHNDIREDTPIHNGSAVFDMMTNKNILDVVQSILGAEITSNPIQHVRIKPPAHLVASDEERAHVVATDWHQDMAVTLPEADATQFVTIWLAITDATLTNGCLQVSPGDYQELLPHCGRKQIGIADDFRPKDGVTPVPVKAGGAVIFSPLTPHCSMDNISDGFRWSFDLRFNVTGQPTGRPQFPDFVARSLSQPDTELRDWQAWQTMWHETRHHLANSPHLPQHRWDANAPFCA